MTHAISPMSLFYMTVQGMMAQQQPSSSQQHDVFGGLTMLEMVEEAALEPAGGMVFRLCGLILTGC